MSIRHTAFNFSWISRELIINNPCLEILETICVHFIVLYVNIIRGDQYHVEPKTNVKAYIFRKFIYTNNL